MQGRLEGLAGLEGLEGLDRLEELEILVLLAGLELSALLVGLFGLFFILNYLAPSLGLTYDMEELPFSVKPEKKVEPRRQVSSPPRWELSIKHSRVLYLPEVSIE